MKYSERLEDYKKSVEKLRQILQENKTEITRDSAIKRFELCFELSWKTTSDFLRSKGIFCRAPKDSFKEAFKYGLISDNPSWIKMIEDRNLTVHTYEEELADKIYNQLNNYLYLFEELLNSLIKKAYE